MVFNRSFLAPVTLAMIQWPSYINLTHNPSDKPDVWKWTSYVKVSEVIVWQTDTYTDRQNLMPHCWWSTIISNCSTERERDRQTKRQEKTDRQRHRGIERDIPLTTSLRQSGRSVAMFCKDWNASLTHTHIHGVWKKSPFLFSW